MGFFTIEHIVYLSFCCLSLPIIQAMTAGTCLCLLICLTISNRSDTLWNIWVKHLSSTFTVLFWVLPSSSCVQHSFSLIYLKHRPWCCDFPSLNLALTIKCINPLTYAPQWTWPFLGVSSLSTPPNTHVLTSQSQLCLYFLKYAPLL